MLHWPDSMVTYLTAENILFSNEAFGQHYHTDVLAGIVLGLMCSGIIGIFLGV